MKQAKLTFIFLTLLTMIVFGFTAQSVQAQTETGCRSTYEQMLRSAPTRPDIAAVFGKSFLNQGCGQLFPTVVEPVKQYIAAVEKQATPTSTTRPVKEWDETNKWRNKFEVGDKIPFSISEKADDFQTCTVTENDPQFVMRVKCNAFKHWTAGTYIVYSESNVRLSKTQAPNQGGQKSNPTMQTGASSSGLKVGEYACYGSGGRIMIGLGFKVLAGNRYTDLDGGNRGTFVVTGETVKFRSGHLDGQTGRNLRNYSFAIGAKAECEPF